MYPNPDSKSLRPAHEGLPRGSYPALFLGYLVLWFGSVIYRQVDTLKKG